MLCHWILLPLKKLILRNIDFFKKAMSDIDIYGICGMNK